MDLKVIEYVSILDERGFFKKMFSQKKLENLVGNKTIKQVNKTFTKKRYSSWLTFPIFTTSGN